MAFKDKVIKTLVEMGEEKTVKEIANGISTRAFFELKEKFEKLEAEILEKQNQKLIAQLDGWEKMIRKTIHDIVWEEFALAKKEKDKK